MSLENDRGAFGEKKFSWVMLPTLHQAHNGKLFSNHTSLHINQFSVWVICHVYLFPVFITHILLYSLPEADYNKVKT